MSKTTEANSNYDELEKMSVEELLSNMNKEDKSVPLAVEKSLPEIEELIKAIIPKMKEGGRLFYIGAGTSGRLGIVDASECPPTFGVPHEMVVGLIAGGDSAIRKAVEFAEDDKELGWRDLQSENISKLDTVIGIAASGSTPYVIGALEKCNENGIRTGCITCNRGSKLAEVANYPIEVEVGPEFVTGSTRMKSGTAQKLVLNMISTSVMIQLGKVRGNKMVDMQLSNNKLVDRGTNMVMKQTSLSYQEANELLLTHGSVRKAVDFYKSKFVMKIILPVVYLGNIEYYSLLNRAEEVYFDVHGHYLKQNFRNRTEMYGANGKLDLIIPVEKHKNHTALGDINISYDHNWPKQHWKSIASAYRSSPYFEFYEDEFEVFFKGNYTNLVEFNLALQTKVLECLSISPVVSFSKKHEKFIEGFEDYRGYFTPKNKSLNYPKEQYNQVFESKYGFIPNLFILDLLFNEGPNSVSFL